MKYLIIGLGIYGSNLARDLTALGHEVIGADNRQVNVDAIKDYISTVYLIDSTEQSALGVLPLNNVDVVIVAIGENFGASVKTVALLKEMGTKHIYARAIDKLHESILEGFEIDRILTPEQRAASDLTHEMELGCHVESLKIDANTFVLKFTAPSQISGERYDSLDLEQIGLRLIAVARLTDHVNLMGIKRKTLEIINIDDKDMIVEPNDVLTVIGSAKSFRSFYRKYTH